MIYQALGFWLIFDAPLFDSDRASRVAELLTDPRWPWQPALIRPSQTPDAPLVAAVQPPVVHDVGDLLCVQLSASVDDAHAPDTEARRQAFIELLAPIIVPDPQP